MNIRRDFIKVVPLAIGSAASLRASDSWDRGDSWAIVGAWNSIHTLPFPPGSFRELLSFADGGVVHETNTFLNANSNLDFSMFGLPSAIDAADGVGVWKQKLRGKGFEVTFRKFLFDSSRSNFGDLLVTGDVEISGNKLMADWHIRVVDLSDTVLTDFGPATSEGSRIG